MANDIPSDCSGYGAGVLPFFSNGQEILLGKEFRKKSNNFVWNEPGGKLDEGETFARAAYREANEETANGLNITLEQVEEAEQKGHYVDYLNPESNFFYRMYCVFFDEKRDLSIMEENRKKNSEKVEMIEWKYFKTITVILWECILSEGEIYKTAKIRYGLLREKQFFKDLDL
jgi:ADP-ribose pyrophosphatase YjhB (NUDIX family)